jgi:sigma-B regulation protein RsbU (phosphoserine phosphatase)
LGRDLTSKAIRLRMFTIEPIALPGKRSALIISSWLDDVNAVASATFRRAAVGTAVVLLIVTGILFSTSVQLIRGRLRLERLRHQMITKELNQARKIQLAWLPSAESGCLSACDIAAANRPASHVSGDFYDWFELDHCRVAVTIGDVTGHGMSAAFLMATTQLLVRTTMRRVQDPAQCLDEVNRQLCAASFSGQFVTMLVAVIDTNRNELQIAAAGHYPPMLSEREPHGASVAYGARSLPMEAALVLGVEPEAPFSTGRFPLQPGCGLLFYTDGVIEARSPGGEYFTTAGVRRALEGVKADQGPTRAQDTVDAVVAAVEQFRGARELLDDLTVVAVQLQPGGAGKSRTAGRTETLAAAL